MRSDLIVSEVGLGGTQRKIPAYNGGVILWSSGDVIETSQCLLALHTHTDKTHTSLSLSPSTRAPSLHTYIHTYIFHCIALSPHETCPLFVVVAVPFHSCTFTIGVIGMVHAAAAAHAATAAAAAAAQQHKRADADPTPTPIHDDDG